MPGAVLHHFVLEEEVGRGGSGVVFRARAPGGGLVAVKVLDPGVALLLHEVRTLARLHHPNVVALVDHGTVPEGLEHPDLVAGGGWVAMEYLPGSLVGRPAPLDWPRLRRLAGEALRALAHAHARDVLHRDVKPGNLLQDPQGRWRLVDFGIAVQRGVGAAIAGTHGYMAPEQAGGRSWQVGPWTDLYGLGHTLLHVLRADAPRVPAALAGWLDRMTAPEPRDRFARAAEALRALDAVDGDEVELDVGAAGAAAGSTSVTFSFDRPLPVVAGAAVPTPTSVPAPPRWLVDAPHPAPDVDASMLGLRTFPLVGRADERQALWQALLTASRTGRPVVIAVRGAQGSGRTRLVHELAAAVDEGGWGQGARVRSVLEELADTLVPAPPEGAGAHRHLADALGWAEDDPRLDAQVALRTGPRSLPPGTRADLLVDLLEHVARAGLVVVAVATGVDHVEDLASRLSSARGPIVLAVAGDLAAARVTVDLPPLPAAERRLLLGLGPPLPPEEAARVEREGQPGDLLAALQRAVVGSGDDAPTEVPPAEQPILAWLAAFGTGAREGWVAEAAGRPLAEVQRLLHEAARGGRATESGRRWTLAGGLYEAMVAADPDRRARCARAGEVLLGAGVWARGAALLAEAGETAGAARAFGEAHQAEWRRHHLSPAIRWCRREIALWSAAGEPRRAAEARTWLHWYRYNAEEVGWEAEAAEVLAEARREGWPEVEGGALQNLAAIRADAEAELRAAETAYLRGGRPAFAEAVRLHRWAQYDPDAAEHLRTWRPETFGELSRLAYLARVHARDGRPQEALRVLADLPGLPDDGRGGARIALDVALAVGAPGVADAIREAFDHEPDRRGPSGRYLLRMLALAEIGDGRWSEAADLVARLGPESTGVDLVGEWLSAAIDAWSGLVDVFRTRQLTPGPRPLGLEARLWIRDRLGPVVVRTWLAHGRQDLAAEADAAREAVASSPFLL